MYVASNQSHEFSRLWMPIIDIEQFSRSSPIKNHLCSPVSKGWDPSWEVVLPHSELFGVRWCRLKTHRTFPIHSLSVIEALPGVQANRFTVHCNSAPESFNFYVMSPDNETPNHSDFAHLLLISTQVWVVYSKKVPLSGLSSNNDNDI